MMDPNAKDLAYLDLLRTAVPPEAVPSQSNQGHALEALPPDVQTAFREAHPMLGLSVTQGTTSIPASTWERFTQDQTEMVMRRMRKRSLALAARRPGPDALDDAPVMAHWIVVYDPAGDGLLLLGTPTGHSYCVGPLTRSSRLCGLAPDGTWARSASRWYRLAQAASFAEMLARHGDKIAAAQSLVLTIHQARAILGAEQAAPEKCQ